MLAALPLQWYVIIPSTPGGMVRLHQVGLLAFAGVVAVLVRKRVLWGAAAAAMPFVVMLVAWLVWWMAVAMYHGNLAVSALQQAVYLGAAVCTAAFFMRSAKSPRALAALRWSAAVSALAVTIGLVTSLLRNGVDPVVIFQQALASGDSEVLQRQLFKSGFVGYGYEAEDAKAQFRHEIIGAVLVSLYVSAFAARMLPFRSRTAIIGYRLSLAMGVVLLGVFLSRSVILAAAIWPVLEVVRVLRAGNLSVRHLWLIYGVLAVISAAGVVGLGQMLWGKFTTDTYSYSQRGSLYETAFESLGTGTAWLLGGVEVRGQSSHNFVIDSWMRGGIVMAVLAAAIMLWLLLVWFRAASRLPVEPRWMVPVVAALGLPIVRMLTAGDGLITVVGWVSLGFVFGALAHRQEIVARSQGDQRPTAASSSPTPAPAP
jgi:hypothetical protein